MSEILIYGAGGLGKEIFALNNLANNRINIVAFYDDYKDISHYCSLPLLGSIQNDLKVMIGIANPTIKETISKALSNQIFQDNLIASDVITNDTIIGASNLVFQRVSFTKDIVIGNHVLIHMNSTIGHDSVIDDFCSVMPGVSISGNVTIGKATLVGSGAVILPSIKIGKYCTIGAGAVVTKDIPDYAVAVGVPARVVRFLER